MKIALYILAAIAFAGPIAGWAYIVQLANAFGTSSVDRGIHLEDYFDMEFLALAALPWLIGIVCLVFAWRLQ